MVVLILMIILLKIDQIPVERGLGPHPIYPLPSQEQQHPGCFLPEEESNGSWAWEWEEGEGVCICGRSALDLQ